MNVYDLLAMPEEERLSAIQQAFAAAQLEVFERFDADELLEEEDDRSTTHQIAVTIHRDTPPDGAIILARFDTPGLDEAAVDGTRIKGEKWSEDICGVTAYILLDDLAAAVEQALKEQRS